MGIKGLFPFIQETAPGAIKDSELKRLTGYTLAIDASAWMYQFLTVVRTGAGAQNLQNSEGEATSHLQGFLMRTLKMLEVGVHPIFVFDGKPPDMKLAVNRARRELRAAAAEEHAAAVASETASAEEVFKAASKSTLVTREHNDSAKKLLRCMGVPVVEAPGEAEAACAQLCHAGKVYASVTEDMDVLTFGSPKQLKNLFDVEGSRIRQGPRPARDIDLSLVLKGLGCDMNRFIEFCILAGCDYLPHLSKIGAKTAFQLLAREGSLQAVTEAIRADKGPKGCSMPDAWDWLAAKELFLKGASEIPDPDQLELALSQPDIGALRALLVEQYQFSTSRVDIALERLRRVRDSGGPVQQRRIDAFFKPAAQQSGTMSGASSLPSPQTKRKQVAEEGSCGAADSNKQQRLATNSSSSSCTRAEAPQLVSLGGTLEEGSSSLSPWPCKICTFVNAPELPYCEMCETKREAIASSSKSPSIPVSSSPGSSKTFMQLKASTNAETCMIDLDD